MKLIPVTIYTDGSCLDNGKPSARGGWATILACKGKEKILSGHTSDKATNNRMELTAVIEGIKCLTAPCTITIVTDSKYVCDRIAKLDDLRKAGWETDKGNTVTNVDLLMKLLAIGMKGKHELKFQLIKGHSGHPQNAMCDKLARAEAMKVQVIA